MTHLPEVPVELTRHQGHRETDFLTAHLCKQVPARHFSTRQRPYSRWEVTFQPQAELPRKKGRGREGGSGLAGRGHLS